MFCLRTAKFSTVLDPECWGEKKKLTLEIIPLFYSPVATVLITLFWFYANVFKHVTTTVTVTSTINIISNFNENYDNNTIIIIIVIHKQFKFRNFRL
jgi:hypothetical protein